MRTIVIAEAISTGANYIADILKRGYEPVILLPNYRISPENIASIEHGRREARRRYPCEPRTIQASEDYEETLAMIRGLDPVLVIPGSESGVELATRLADDLGLPGNPYADIDVYTKKSEMHAALLRAGVRGIRGKLVRNYAEASAFMDEIGSEDVVVKPTRSAGSQGLKLCSSREEVREGIDAILGQNNYYGDLVEQALIQERIFGTEYIINTMSRCGKHKLLSIWKYDKVKTDKGGNVYNYCESIEKLEIGHSELVEYAFSVLDALGVKDGPVHGEFMIDKKGPVLIEVNCRPMGGNLFSGYVDRIFGHHETDAILDAYLDEETFLRHLEDPYRPLRKGYFKILITPKDVDVEASPICLILDRMRSVYRYSLSGSSEPFHLDKTEDLESNSGMIYLVHDDAEISRRECELLHLLETDYFRILFHGTGKKETPPSEDALSVAGAIQAADCRGSVLIVSDLGGLPGDVCRMRPDELSSGLKDFDQVFFALGSYGEGRQVEATVSAIFSAMEKVKYGGRFIVPESFYQRIPYGRALIEALLVINGFTIAPPTCEKKHLVIGTR